MQLYRKKLWIMVVIMSLGLSGFLAHSFIKLDLLAITETGWGIDKSGSREEEIDLESCIFKESSGVEIALRHMSLHWCQKQHFLEKPGPVVALASFPGSGSTWLRYLLQQATGVLTGSVHKECILRHNAFPAQNVANGSVSVVKIHRWGPEARKPFHKAVLLVRDPGATIQAEFNRKNGGRVGFASPDLYKRNKSKDWQQFVAGQLREWHYMNLDWLLNFTRPIHVMFYEDLVRDTKSQLHDVLKFLKLQVTESELNCALFRKEGIYRREGTVKTFDPYSEDMKAALAKEQEAVYSVIRKFNASR